MWHIAHHTSHWITAKAKYREKGFVHVCCHTHTQTFTQIPAFDFVLFLWFFVYSAAMGCDQQFCSAWFSVDFKAYIIALDFIFKPISDLTYVFIYNMLYYLFTFMLLYSAFQFSIFVSFLLFFSLNSELSNTTDSRIHIQSMCQKREKKTFHLFALCMCAFDAFFCVFAPPFRTAKCHTCIIFDYLAHRKYSLPKTTTFAILHLVCVLLLLLAHWTTSEWHTEMNCYLYTYEDLLASNSRKKYINKHNINVNIDININIST